jgi:hypothetical protein
VGARATSETAKGTRTGGLLEKLRQQIVAAETSSSDSLAQS